MPRYGMSTDRYQEIALGVESAWPSAEMQVAIGGSSGRAPMPSIVRNVILIASSVAFALAAVRGIAALPEALHGAGLIVPHAWEQAIVESLDALR